MSLWCIFNGNYTICLGGPTLMIKFRAHYQKFFKGKKVQSRGLNDKFLDAVALFQEGMSVKVEDNVECDSVKILEAEDNFEAERLLVDESQISKFMSYEKIKWREFCVDQIKEIKVESGFKLSERVHE